MKLQKLLALIIGCILGMGTMAMAGCSDGKGNNLVVYSGSEIKSLDVGEVAEYIVDKDLEFKKYLTMELDTDINLRGEWVYYQTDRPEKVTSEPFFIEANSKEFSQFLDVYRSKGKERTKTLQKVMLKNVSSYEGEVMLKKISFTDRDLVQEHPNAKVYLEDDAIKIGVDLNWGGGVFYLERKNFGVKQVVDADGYASIVTGEAPAGTTIVFGEDEPINLINTYDPGRLIQQSYYGMVYDPVTTISYNPVQGGNGYGPSQIIDYSISDDLIYVKCRANDWNKDETTPSYMENWYSIQDGLIRVKNRFIDFSDLDHSKNDAIQEVPACYPIYPLNKFICFEGNEPFQNKALYENEDLTFWVGGGYHGFNVSESWCAWVSEENFGVGMYTPSVTSASAGRHTGTTYDEAKKIDGDASKLVQTVYSSMNVHFVMQNYEAFEYTYFLMVDYVDTMRAQFYELNKTEENPFLSDKNYNR